LSNRIEERDGGRAGPPLPEARTRRRGVLASGALLCAVAVALGAFGAHGLKDRLAAEQLGWWQTAVQYQMWHGLALVALGASDRRALRLPAWLLATGAFLFSSSLYALALGAPRSVGIVTPGGGILMIGGWILLAWRMVGVKL